MCENCDRLTAALAAAEREVTNLREIVYIGTLDNPDFGDYSKSVQNFMDAWATEKDRANKVESERDSALAQLATARNEALEEAANLIHNWAGQCRHFHCMADAIRALKTATAEIKEEMK